MARLLAYKVLMKYVKDDGYLNIVLNDALKHSDINRQDKDLVTKIVYGTVQNKLYLEYLLEPYLKDKKVKNNVKWILLLSAYQLIFLDKVPDYAVINEGVALSKDRYAGKFINVILRRFNEEEKRSLDDLDEDNYLSISTSHPLWIVKMLKKQYGYKVTKKILEADNLTPNRTCRVNTLKTTKEALLKDEAFEEGKVSEDALNYRSGNIANTSYYQNGLVTIQDESSQLVARILDPQEDDYVLDMCCAPGSKTTHLSCLMNNKGCIEAYDLFEHKIELVKNNIERLGVTNINLHVGDSTKLDEVYPANTFDKILLDGPCSGLGVMKRKPEIRYHDSSMMDTIIPLQRKLLEKAYYLLKNNGKMVYSTCTINKKENEKMIVEFIENHPDMKILKEETILNYQYNSDGFYICKLVKG